MSLTLHDLLTEHLDAVVDEYVRRMRHSTERYANTPPEQIRPNALRSVALLKTLYREVDDTEARQYIRSLCQQRVPQGFLLSEVLQAIFLLGDVVIPIIRRELKDDDEQRQEAQDQLRAGLNRLALLWSDGFFQLADELMARKQQAIRELSTPVIRIWDGILTLPLIGDVDDDRSQQITEDLLATIEETRSIIVLLDITGIGSVDTKVIAQLMRTVRAAELLGSKCWIVGVSPEVANTVVNLGLDLRSITTHANLRQGLEHAFRYLGLAVTPRPQVEAPPRRNRPGYDPSPSIYLSEQEQ